MLLVSCKLTVCILEAIVNVEREIAAPAVSFVSSLPYNSDFGCKVTKTYAITALFFLLRAIKLGKIVKKQLNSM